MALRISASSVTQIALLFGLPTSLICLATHAPQSHVSTTSTIWRISPFRPETAPMIEVSRTLMKSEPELADLVAEVEGVEVTMAEKGFGTRVAIQARPGTGLVEADLERILDDLAEPRKKPFA